MKDTEIIDMVRKIERKFENRIELLEKKVKDLEHEVYCLKCQVASR